MAKNLNIFLNKKILIYGLGKTGLSTYKFLKDKNKVFLFDDFLSSGVLFNEKKKIINYKSILKSDFDHIESWYRYK